MAARDDSEVAFARINPPSKDWPTLLNKLFDEFTRVFQGEVKLLGASVGPAIESAVVRGLYHLTLAVIGLCGVLCLIAAMVLVLRRWLEWWQAFGAIGLAIVLVVIVVSRIPSGRTS